jgi:3-oxoadipate enol-lactonase
MPYINVNDVKIYYETHGKGDTIVFLNGILANTSSWMKQVAFFSRRFRVILLDFRGQGNSDKPATKYPMEMHAEDVKALLDHLGISSVHMVGISFGGEVALVFAAKYPERLRSLVVACAVSHVTPSVKTLADRWLVAARLRSGKDLFEIVCPDLFSDEFIKSNWDFVNSTAPLYDVGIDIDAFIELLKGFMQLNIAPRLSRIRTPTLVIAAEQDKLKPEHYSKAIHEHITGSKFVIIKKSGHTVIWERPEEFNVTVADFILSTAN